MATGVEVSRCQNPPAPDGQRKRVVLARTVTASPALQPAGTLIGDLAYLEPCPGPSGASHRAVAVGQVVEFTRPVAKQQGCRGSDCPAGPARRQLTARPAPRRSSDLRHRVDQPTCAGEHSQLCCCRSERSDAQQGEHSWPFSARPLLEPLSGST